MMEDQAPTRAQQILQAASGCFARRGFHQTTMQDIAEAAGLTAGALYRYFGSKDELIVALVAEDQRQVLERISAVLEEPDTERALAALLAFGIEDLSDPERNAVRFEVAAEAARNPLARAVCLEIYDGVLERLRVFVQRGIDEGVFAPPFDARSTAQFLLALGDGLAYLKTICPETDLTPMAQTLAGGLPRLLGMRLIEKSPEES